MSVYKLIERKGRQVMEEMEFVVVKALRGTGQVDLFDQLLRELDRAEELVTEREFESDEYKKAVDLVEQLNDQAQVAAWELRASIDQAGIACVSQWGEGGDFAIFLAAKGALPTGEFLIAGVPS